MEKIDKIALLNFLRKEVEKLNTNSFAQVILEQKLKEPIKEKN